MKNLVYTCLSYKKEYFCLLELFLNSLAEQYTINSNFDVVLITEEQFANAITQPPLPIKVLIVPPASNADIAMSYKYVLFDWLKEQNYNKVLFADVDCVFVKHPDNIFNTINDTDLFVKQEQGDINDQFHCQGCLTEQQIEQLKLKNITYPLNSGTFAFSTKSNISNEFIKFNKWLISETQINTRHPGCDQTFLNLYFLNKNITTSLNKYVTICQREEPTSDTVIYHSVGGEYYHKYDNLKQCYEHR